MNINMICDMGGMIYLLLAFAIYMTIIAFTVIIMMEAIILWRMKWGSFKQSFLISAGINLISGAVGYALIRVLGDDAVLDYLQDQFWVFMIVNCLLTICIEGSLVVLFKHSDWQFSLRAAVYINIASYIWNVVFLQILLRYMNVL